MDFDKIEKRDLDLVKGYKTMIKLLYGKLRKKNITSDQSVMIKVQLNKLRNLIDLKRKSLELSVLKGVSVLSVEDYLIDFDDKKLRKNKQ
jgi:hypothetical protein